jgi:hypothetical protein
MAGALPITVNEDKTRIAVSGSFDFLGAANATWSAVLLLLAVAPDRCSASGIKSELLIGWETRVPVSEKAARLNPPAPFDREHDGDVRRVCRNVKRWRNAAMALRWTATGMMEAAKGFRCLKAYRLHPSLKIALVAHAADAHQGD